nr:EF-P lysine aminoacylase EpmA [uncultured Methylophaga sp.]
MYDKDWQPSASLENLKRRAQFLTEIRRFFYQREVLEVDTPILSHTAPTAPYLDSFTTDYIAAGGQKSPCYLHTSPEFAMKRLLAAGLGDMYQIAKVFRNGEQGRHHSPEFTMLEWYRPSLSYHQLMTEVDDLLQTVVGLSPAVKMSYQTLFSQYLSIDVTDVEQDELKQYALSRIKSLPQDWQTDKDGWLELLMSELIEPQLALSAHPYIIYDFPASQAQLAKLHRSEEGHIVAARFEVYAQGLELANGYDECLDADELSQRFVEDNLIRHQQGKSAMPVDKHLLAAMQAGLPACCGVAIGVDRLLMLKLSVQHIDAVKSFTFEQS